jgi:hypothetical protein
MKSLRGTLLVFVVAAFCSGCAHQISISPNLEKVASNAVQPKIEQSVGYFISEQNRALETTTPGGGGDLVKYRPYADLEAGLARVLSSIFSGVHLVKDVKDQDFLRSKNITWIFTPTIRTTSSSRNSFFWPPTDFSVSIDCIAIDANQREIWKTTVTADGGVVAVNDIIKDHALAATNAAQKALGALRAKIQTAPEFGSPANATNSVNIPSQQATTLNDLKDLLPAAR